MNEEIHNLKLKNIKYRRRCEWFEKGQTRCMHCQRQLNWAPGFINSATIEHLVPKSKNGTMHVNNVIIVCFDCNQTRGNEDYIKWVRSNNYENADYLVSLYMKSVETYKKSKRKLSKDILKEYYIHKDKLKEKTSLHVKPQTKQKKSMWKRISGWIKGNTT